MPTEPSATATDRPTPAPRALRQWLLRAGWGIAGLLALWVLAWVAVPPLLKSQVEKRGSEALGRTLTLESIDFAPWSLELTLRGLKVATADGQGTQLSVDRLYVDAELQSALRLAPVVDAITVDAPRVWLTHLGDGRYDIDDILKRLADRPNDPSDKPLQFALYNLTIQGGELDFVDQRKAATQTHTLRKLQLSVPFLSNLDSQRDVLVEPRLAFELNGSALDTAGQGTPFAQTRKGEATLGVHGMALTPYLPYLPANLPVRPRAAVLDMDLHLKFEQAAKTSLLLTGGLQLSGMEVADATGGELLKVQGVQLQLGEIRPLEKRLDLASLVIDAPSLRVQRNRQGRLNLQPPGTSGAAARPQSADPGGDSAWQVSLAKFALTHGQLQWQDDTVQPQARAAVRELSVQASGLQWPQRPETPATRFEVSLALNAAARGAARAAPAAQLALQGQGNLQGGQAQLQLRDLRLEALAPYVAQYLVPSVEGRLGLEASLGWKGADYSVDVARLAVEKFSLKGARPEGGRTPAAPDATREWLGWKQLELRHATLQWPQQTLRVGKLSLTQPMARVRRDADGQWMVAQWFPPAGEGPTVAQPAPPTAPATSAARPAAWKLQLQELQVAQGQLSWVDRSVAKPVFLELSSLSLAAKGLTPEGAKPATVALRSVVRSGRTDPGMLGFQGSVQWAPVQARGVVELTDLPLHALVPYAAAQVAYLNRIDVQRADANFKGQVDFRSTDAGPSVVVQGDASLDDLRVNHARPADAIAAGASLQEAEELLSWKSLAVPGIALAMAPGTATRVTLREVSLADFFARMVVTPQGQLQLQELVHAEAAPPAHAAPAGASAAATSAATPAATAASATPASTGPAAQIDVGPIRLLNGRIAFSDRFIQPNYSASLTELQGRLSRFSSQPVQGVVQMADLELRGRAEGTATLEVTGKLNPLAKPLALDIQGRVRDLELSPLSAYAVKYSGYGIERGKLSVDVNYKVLSDGQLTAGNRIILNQLTFGDKVEGATASLPVKLAVALLADRNGVIDVDLPISGSLNDPQFSIWPVVWKVIGNLITKALTAPFALFIGGGGGEELSSIAFAPGTADLAPTGRTALDKVARALQDRPALRMTVVGSASLEAERDAIKRKRLQAMVLSEKRRVAAAAGQNAAALSQVEASEYPELLKEVYRRADMKKPRNLVGMTKTLPVPEMEALLLANMAVTEDAVRELAQARGVAVRDYLTGKTVASERLFLGASKTAAADAGFKPQAELTLSNR